MTAPSTLDDTLSDRQLRFVFEYLIDQNASAAAARAGYSEKSRASQANELMKNEAVRERIRLELASLLAEVGCSEMQLILERRRAAFFRAEQMFRSGWEPLPPGEMEEEARRAVEVSAVMGRSGPVIKVRQPDRHKALRALERVHERLEKANQVYWARLEKEGRCRSLAEIDAMYGEEGQAPLENAEKSWDLYGSADGVGAPAVEIPEKDGDLYGAGPGAATGSGLGANDRGRAISEKPAVLSGLSAGAGAPGGRIPAAALVLQGAADVPGAALASRRAAPEEDGAAARWLMRTAPPPDGRLRVA